MSGRPVVDVAVGVLIRADGRFLLASRPAGKPYADYWEFPGGKVEHREAVPHALSRELHEELGIDVGNVGEVVAAGARRIVVLRAIRDAGDPEEAAAALRAALTG